MKVGDVFHGFYLKKLQKVEEINCYAYIFEHEKTLAKALFLHNNDKNRAFSIGFKTPTKDNKGIPHILEHCVLSGSKKYPIKDPFRELLANSLSTFLNAGTFPDKTIYHFSTTNQKDFRNLMSVYLDAVFYPNIRYTEEIFMQEGWHYELNKDLKYNGIVYNEMKGALSSPESILINEIMKSLYPNTIYANEAGGDPIEIVQLSHKDLVAYHEYYYHPSNAYIFFYGDVDITENLQFLDKQYLSNFNHKKINADISLEKQHNQISHQQRKYSVSNSESTQNKTYLSLNFSIEKSTDRKLSLTFKILEYLLLETEGAPLKIALEEQNLGESIHGVFSDDILQPFFSIIVKNSNENRKTEFTETVIKTLQNLAKNGLDIDLVEGAINRIEFNLRELESKDYPRGIKYNLKALKSWIHDDQPLTHLEFEKHLKDIRKEIQNGYFENIIIKYILNNQHRSIVSVVPEKGLANKLEKQKTESLKKQQQQLSKDKLELIKKKKGQLIKHQQEPDKPKDLAKIPKLSLQDVNKNIEKIPQNVETLSNATLLLHPLETNNILYIELFFDTKHIPLEQLQYLTLLSQILSKLNTSKYGYEELNHLINKYTGGIDISAQSFHVHKSFPKYEQKFVIKTKCLFQNIETTLKILEEIINSTIFTDKERFQTLLKSIKSNIESNIHYSGETVAVTRLASYFSEQGKYQEHTTGISYYHFLRNLEKDFQVNWNHIEKNIKELSQKLFTSNEAIINVTCDEKQHPSIKLNLEKLLDSLPNRENKTAKYNIETANINEGIAMETDVQYIAKGYDYNLLGYKYSGQMAVLSTILNNKYLWTEVRIKGGAYVSRLSLSHNGRVILSSFRDPNLEETIKTFNSTADFLKKLNLSKSEMEQLIIGTIGKFDKPLTPEMKGSSATRQYLSQITNKDLQKIKDEIFDTTNTDIQGYSTMFRELMNQDYHCVVSNKNQLQKHKSLFNEIVDVFE